MKTKSFIKIFILWSLVFGNLDKVIAENFSIQVKSFPMAERENAFQFYNELKDAGYFVYMHKTKIDKNWWIRIKIGCFNTTDEAEQFGKNFKSKSGIDYWVNPANVLIDKSNANFAVLTTPSGIWVKKNSNFKEVYSLPLDDAGVLTETKAIASFVSDEIVFYFQQKLIKVNLNSKKVLILKEVEEIEELNNSSPKWSYDGKYIAYMDSYTWEIPTKLWLIKNDGSNDTCIVKDKNKQMKVKDFWWHPSKYEIFYVYGPAYGALDFGGKLYSINLGTMEKRMIVTTEEPYLILKARIDTDGIFLTIIDGIHFKKRIYKKIPFPDNSILVTIKEEDLK